MRRSGPPVVVPENVRGQWASVRLAITDREGGRSEFSAPLGEVVALGKEALSVRAETFLPSYMSDSARISSASNAQDNPAVFITLIRDGAEINEGWVFRDWPQFNTFASHFVRIELLSAEPADGGASQTQPAAKGGRAGGAS